MRYVYPCVLTPEEEGGFFVSFPDIPGALTCGDDRVEALEMAEDALAVALAGYVHERWDIPNPRPAEEGQEMVAVPPVVGKAGAVYSHARQGVTWHWRSDLA